MWCTEEPKKDERAMAEGRPGQSNLLGLRLCGLGTELQEPPVGPGEGEGRQVREGQRGREKEISAGNKGQRVSMPKWWRFFMINPNFALPFGAP